MASLALVAGCVFQDDQAFEPSVVVEWNEVTLAAIRQSPPRPTVNSRSLYLVHAAIYDAWAAYEPAANGVATGGRLRRPASERHVDNKRVALSYAAYAALTRLYPQYEAKTGAFAQQMLKLGLPTDSATLARRDLSSPIGLGNQVAETVLSARLQDGSNQENNYAEITSTTYPALYQPTNVADPSHAKAPGGAAFDAMRWQPLRLPTGKAVDPVTKRPIVVAGDPSSYVDQKYLTPHWGAVAPFALAAGSQVRPPGPPRFGSAEPYVDALGVPSTHDEAYRRQINEIVTLTAQLTQEQKVIAEYWADGPDSVTPPGHWNEIAADLSFKYRQNLDADVRMFFALNAALMDSAIACWEAKRAYDFIRPVSAIRDYYFHSRIPSWAGPGLGTQLLAGSEWKPFQASTFVTPAFAEFTSGHSTFSAAAAEVLRVFTGSDLFYDGVTRVPRDRDHDGSQDLVGQFVMQPGMLTIEAGLPSQPVTLRWSTLKDAADQAGMSRRFGGIHFQDGDIYGRRMGEKIGQMALQKAADYWTGKR